MLKTSTEKFIKTSGPNVSLPHHNGKQKSMEELPMLFSSSDSVVALNLKTSYNYSNNVII